MSKRQASNVHKSALVRWVNQEERHTLISESKSSTDELIEGELVYYKLENGLSIHGGHTHELKDYQVIASANKAMIVVVLLDGKLDFSYDDLRFKFDAKRSPIATVVNLTQPVAFRRTLLKDNKVCKLNIVLPHGWIKQRDQSDELSTFIDQHLASFRLDLTTQMKELVNRVISFNTPRDLLQKLEMEAQAQMLLVHIIQQIKQGFCPTYFGNERVKRLHEDSVDELVAYIESHLDRDISTEELAHYSKMSESSLRRKFKEAFGVSLQGYIRRRKLEIAHQHLERGVASISEVAYNAGYRYPSNFTNAFKKRFGVPPEEVVNHYGR